MAEPGRPEWAEDDVLEAVFLTPLTAKMVVAGLPHMRGVAGCGQQVDDAGERFLVSVDLAGADQAARDAVFNMLKGYLEAEHAVLR